MADEGSGTIPGGVREIAGRVLTGWLRGSADGPARLVVELLSDGQMLGSTVAELDETSGRLAFEFMLPMVVLDGQAHRLTARLDGHELALENGLRILGEATTAPQLKAQGWLEKISEDGWVIGWAWYPETPELLVEVEILVDGQVAGSTVAGLYRADVEKAGFGSGCYGFSWPLPVSVLLAPRDVTVSARDKNTGFELPKPIMFRQKAVADAFSRIAELENDIRLLNATISGLERRHAQEERATVELFRTVGAFFIDLAAGQGQAPARQVSAAVGAVSTRFAPLEFTSSAAPQVTVLVQAASSLEASHASLTATREALGGLAAEVVLVDDGRCDETPLLSLIVRSLRYAKLPGGEAVARCNDAMRLGSAPVLVWVQAGVRPAGDWHAALSAFEKRPGLAVLAAHTVRSDTAMFGTGMVLDKAETVQTDEAAPVNAAAAACFAVLHRVWLQQGGLDEGYTGLGAALVDFCVRTKTRGHVTGVDPAFSAVLETAFESTNVADDAADARRLRGVIDGFKEAAE